MVRYTAKLEVVCQSVAQETGDAVVGNGIDDICALSHVFVHPLNRQAQIDGLVWTRTAKLALANYIEVCCRLELWQVVNVGQAIELAVNKQRGRHILEWLASCAGQTVSTSVEKLHEWSCAHGRQGLEMKSWSGVGTFESFSDEETPLLYDPRVEIGHGLQISEVVGVCNGRGAFWVPIEK